MSSRSMNANPSSSVKTSRRNQNYQDEQHPLISKPPTAASNRDRKLLKATHRALRDISREVSAINQACSRASVGRIHSTAPPASTTWQRPSDVNSKQTAYSRSSMKENTAPLSRAPPTNPDIPHLLQPPSDSMLRVPRPTGAANPPILRSPNANENKGPLKIVFSGSLVAEPPRSDTASKMHPRPLAPHRTKRCRDSPFRYEAATSEFAGYPKINMTRSDSLSIRNPQGHRAPSRSVGKPTLVPRIQPEPINVQALETYRQDTNAALSSLSSRVGFLEGAVAAALPIVAEARLLWMENTVVQARTKLSTTRQALCQYYADPKYMEYTAHVRARAYYLGLTSNDLDYLKERLSSLGESQHANRETIVVSPFGSGNESGDKVMVDSFRSNSKQGTYARHIWRVCYDRAYSVNEDWSVPAPTPDGSKLVNRIKAWLSST
ncbi:hypothetical protein BDV93DRAFT_554716 [Ceratobasidium sp. AG-I]|nr:hypothetical protein BDV93DRAFT_554716 [Ceratobasidium sp. AG-I]